MKRRDRILVAMLILVTLCLALAAGYIMSTGSPAQGRGPFPRVSHSPISIYDASDFTPPDSTSGCRCVVAGSGTLTDPFSIAGWDIDASGSNGISISYVDEHFAISQVSISGTELHTGIRLEEVHNGRISDSAINGTFTAIYVLLSSNVTIADNLISESEFGIELQASEFNEVTHNTMNRIAQVSIFVRGSDNLVEANRIDEGYGGINVDGTAAPADRNLVKYNTVRRTEVYGISLWRARNNTIASNIVSDGRGGGIVVMDSSSNNMIENNDVRQNRGDGIFINEGSFSNVVQRNASVGNGDGVSMFDLHSDGPDNIWTNNTFGTRRPDTLE